MNTGNRRYADGNYTLALQSYNEAIQLCPEAAAYYCKRSQTLIMLSNFKGALQDSLSAVERDYRSERGYECTIVCYLSLGDIIRAEPAIAKLVEIGAENDTCAHYVEQCNQLRTAVARAMQCFNGEDFQTAGMC